MSRQSRITNAGFTLIEIMIVVVIIGILAAIAIPLYLDWVNHSKHAEAQENLRIIADGALTYYQEEHGDAAGVTTNRYPDGSLCTEGGADADGNRTDPTATNWDHELWKTLRFAVSKPHYFRYCYASGSGGETFAATADAALSGDGAIDAMYCVRGESGPNVGGVFEVDPGFGCDP